MSICYGIFLAPRTAWYPISRRMFKGLGVLVQLGLSGVGMHFVFMQQKWDPLKNFMNRSNRFRMVGLGISCSCSFSVRFSPAPAPAYANNMIHQTWSDSARSSICTSRLCIFDLPSPVRIGCSNIRSVGFLSFILFSFWYVARTNLPRAESEISSGRKMLDAHL